MRKSSFGGGRPSLASGAPLRVRHENSNTSQRGGRKSTQGKDKTKSRSLSFAPRSSIGVSSYKPGGSQLSFLPKSGRPSSGIGVRGRTDVPKDPRPISDKKYHNQCIRQLLEFLMANNYPHAVSQKLLVSPTSKDFFKIFAFIYSKLHPGYKMATKMEEEVPRVLKMMAYPFSLSKTYLYSVGSPHTWPHLLGALIWMLDLIEMAGNIPSQGGIDAFIFGDANGEEFDVKSEDQTVYEYCEGTYAAFMRGADTFEEFDNDLRILLKQKYQGENMESMVEENRRLESELELVEQNEEWILKLREGIACLKQDEQTTLQYLENLEKFKRSVSTELSECEESCKMLSSDLESEKARVAEMQMIYQCQDLTPSDVDRLKAEQARLRLQVEMVQKQVEEIDADNWKVSMDMSNVNEKVENEVATYNRLAIVLKLVPETAELANGIDFRLFAGFSADIVGKFESTIKPMLKSIKNECMEEARRKDKEMFQLQCELEKLEESVHEQTEQMVQQEKKLASLEGEINSVKQMIHSDKKSVSSEMESVQQDLAQRESERAALEAARTEAEKDYKEAHRLLEGRRQEASKELSDLQELKKKVTEAVTAHKEIFKNQMAMFVRRLETVDREMDQRLDRLKEEAHIRDKQLSQTLARLQ
ncbi:kinetochore protein NDC80 homolog [Aplysia californica]|uniref:Kinetochore protein NDC80 n=1 Tax=Aplysia californica TaxID=6500 RepID=A0ABM0ZZI7_APLCA|nr:kinetochore protein NDC80 homolog [Aplysia californica]